MSLESLFRVKVSAKGQIVIPKPLREAFHFHEGESILLIPREKGVLMRHAPKEEAARLRGLLKSLDVDVAECEAILTSAKKSLLKIVG